MPKLTTFSVEHAKPAEKRTEIPDSVVVGLYLVVQATGAKSWAVRYRHQRQPKKLTLGSYPAVSLATARELAREALADVAKGTDPAAEKARRGKARTVAELVDLFVEGYAKRRQKDWRETERVLVKDVAGVWGKREITSITRADVNQLINDIIARPAPHMSNRVLRYLRVMWSWAIEEGLAESSPCDRVRRKVADIKRDRTLTDDEIRVLWSAWIQQGWPYGHIQRLLLVTGQRVSEVADAEWSEFDLDRRLWLIPGARRKTGEAHLVPLSSLAMEIISGLPRIAESPFLFPGPVSRKPVAGHSDGKDETIRLLAEAGHELPDWRWHDLRRTCRTNLSRLGVPPHISELVIGHAVTGLLKVYDRWQYLEEKRAALEAWAGLIRDTLDPSRKIIAFPQR